MKVRSDKKRLETWLVDTIVFVGIVTVLKRVWFTNYWWQIFAISQAKNFMWGQCGAVWFPKFIDVYF